MTELVNYDTRLSDTSQTYESAIYLGDPSQHPDEEPIQGPDEMHVWL